MPIIKRTIPVELRGVEPAVHPDYKLEKAIERQVKADLATMGGLDRIEFRYHRFEIVRKDDEQAKAYLALKNSMAHPDSSIIHDTVIEHRYMMQRGSYFIDVVIVEYYEGVNEPSPSHAQARARKEAPKGSSSGDG